MERERSDVSKSSHDIQKDSRSSNPVLRKGDCRELSFSSLDYSASSTSCYSNNNNGTRRETDCFAKSGQNIRRRDRTTTSFPNNNNNQYDMHDDDDHDPSYSSHLHHHTRRDFRVYAEEFEPGHEIFQAIEEVLNRRRDNNDMHYSYR
jgi:hypothetical protein